MSSSGSRAVPASTRSVVGYQACRVEGRDQLRFMFYMEGLNLGVLHHAEDMCSRFGGFAFGLSLAAALPGMSMPAMDSMPQRFVVGAVVLVLVAAAAVCLVRYIHYGRVRGQHQKLIRTVDVPADVLGNGLSPVEALHAFQDVPPRDRTQLAQRLFAYVDGRRSANEARARQFALA